MDKRYIGQKGCRLDQQGPLCVSEAHRVHSAGHCLAMKAQPEKCRMCHDYK